MFLWLINILSANTISEMEDIWKDKIANADNKKSLELIILRNRYSSQACTALSVHSRVHAYKTRLTIDQFEKVHYIKANELNLKHVIFIFLFYV